MRTKFNQTALAALAALSGLAAAPAQAWNTLDGNAPLVIAHRGASGYLPEHTLEGYAKAIQLGANYIEPDLVMTRDGILVARHEPVIGDSTNVRSLAQFADRMTTKTIDGVKYENQYFVEDFTLAELKTLGAKQTRAGRPTEFDGQFKVPTLDEVIALAKAKSFETGRTIGIYPELKHSTYMQGVSQSLGFGKTYFEDKLVSTLHAAYGNTGSAPVFIQSFEVSNLQYLNTKTDIKLVQLVDADDVNADGSMSLVAPYDRPFDVAVRNGKLTFADLVSNVGLSFVATYADGVGPWKPYLASAAHVLGADGKPRDLNGDGKITDNDRVALPPTDVVKNAHAAGLFVHAYTFRSESPGLLSDYKGDPKAEYKRFYALGVDGLFSDFPDTAVAARDSK